MRKVTMFDETFRTMSIHREKHDSYDVLKLSCDKLDNSIAPELKSALTLMSKEGVKNIIIDLTEAKYCDSSGLSAILVANRLCKNAGGVLVLTNIHPTISKLITISQLDSVLNIVPNVRDAIDLVFLETIQNDSPES